MSPEPVQEPFDQNLKADSSVAVNMRVENESDSEDDSHIEDAGYLPLSQVPTDGDVLLDDDEDDEWVSAVDTHQIFSVDTSDSQQEEQTASETIQVWSSVAHKSTIDLDAKKIDQVKSMMASFRLPSTAIPEWASSVREDQWKDQLIHRITEMQQK